MLSEALRPWYGVEMLSEALPQKSGQFLREGEKRRPWEPEREAGSDGGPDPDSV